MQQAVYGLQALSTVGSTVSQIRAGNAYGAAGEKEAASERLAAQYNRGLEAYKNRQILGKQRTVMGASNLDVSAGSLQDLALESARQAAMDEAAITYGGNIRAEQSRTQGRIAQTTLRQRGYSSLTAGMGTLLSSYYNKFGTGGGTPTSRSIFDSGGTTGDMGTRTSYQDLIANPNRFKFSISG